MPIYLTHLDFLICNCGETLAFYVGKLGFTLADDTYRPEQAKRWVMIRPPGVTENATTILLSHASTDHQARYIGDQADGRVFLFLATDDFARDHAAFTAAGVEWVCPPADYEYGRVAVFKDLFGNPWDLVQHAASAGATSATTWTPNRLPAACRP